MLGSLNSFDLGQFCFFALRHTVEKLKFSDSYFPRVASAIAKSKYMAGMEAEQG